MSAIVVSETISRQRIRVLVLEDSATDAEIVIRELRAAGFDSDWTRVETESDFLAALDRNPDLILADFSLPAFDGMSALEIVRGRGLDTPFLLISGVVREEDAVTAIKHGADDYLLKDRLLRLGPAVEQAFESQRLREEQRKFAAQLRASEERYRTLVQALPVAVYSCDLEGRVTAYNDAAESLWERKPTLGHDLWCGSWKIFEPDGSPLPLEECPMAIVLREGRSIRDREVLIERPDGERRHVIPYPTPLHDASGKLVGAVNTLIDITTWKQMENSLLKLNETLEERVRDPSAVVSARRQRVDQPPRSDHHGDRPALPIGSAVANA